ncbi:glycosyl hydrolase family 38 N-terminal domain protein [Spiroplasma clarkii]|nr:glycosyl hydrolase family 38 N-terminal domain protein [Spiroplasma clarkii]
MSNNEISKFTLDGQVSVIDDYLKYKSANLGLVKHFLETERLIIGPWYTQPDLFNSSSEAIVRNLIYGMNRCREFGAEPMMVAYVPDSFGHNNQMPQIYKSLGISDFIYWRGISKEMLDDKKLISFWKGIDGTKVLAYNMMYGYLSFGSNFNYNSVSENQVKLNAKNFLENTKEIINEIKEKSQGITKEILIPLGGDQAPPPANLVAFVNELNLKSKDDWLISNYEKFMRAIHSNSRNIETIEGELKKPYLSRIHRTIGSQRQYIKNLIKEAEMELFYNLEPLMVYNYFLTRRYQTIFMRRH